ncbi:MAG: hypothetical protein RMZ43_019500 [Nostoc sp. CmiVER01]|uniref:hypothetical protein n=1 Tax=Nostoc sp. CmiVER01 TaxID=3075384 RepID=UPI003D16189B
MPTAVNYAVNQGGRRVGAVTVSLDVWNLDLPEFLEMQTTKFLIKDILNNVERIKYKY